MTVYRKSMMEALAEVRGIQEASMSSAQIAKLKKAYEPMRDKKISTANANRSRTVAAGPDPATRDGGGG